MDSIVKDATEIQSHPNKFNRDNRFMLSKTWQPLLYQLCNKVIQNKGQTQQSLDSAH